MTIYTRRGDGGDTSLADGSRVPKNAERVEAYGSVDEANSAVGFARAAADDPRLDELLGFVQQRLFNCSSSLAWPTPDDRAPRIAQEDVEALEHSVDELQAIAGPLTGFVLEGGCELAARLQLARAVLRRAERRTVTLAATSYVDPLVLAFLNRASDALFSAARAANEAAGVKEELWDPNAKVYSAARREGSSET